MATSTFKFRGSVVFHTRPPGNIFDAFPFHLVIVFGRAAYSSHVSTTYVMAEQHTTLNGTYRTRRRCALNGGWLTVMVRNDASLCIALCAAWHPPPPLGSYDLSQHLFAIRDMASCELGLGGDRKEGQSKSISGGVNSLGWNGGWKKMAAKIRGFDTSSAPFESRIFTLAC